MQKTNQTYFDPMTKTQHFLFLLMNSFPPLSLIFIYLGLLQSLLFLRINRLIDFCLGCLWVAHHASSRRLVNSRHMSFDHDMRDGGFFFFFFVLVHLEYNFKEAKGEFAKRGKITLFLRSVSAKRGKKSEIVCQGKGPFSEPVLASNVKESPQRP